MNTNTIYSMHIDTLPHASIHETPSAFLPAKPSDIRRSWDRRARPSALSSRCGRGWPALFGPRLVYFNLLVIACSRSYLGLCHFQHSFIFLGSTLLSFGRVGSFLERRSSSLATFVAFTPIGRTGVENPSDLSSSLSSLGSRWRFDSSGVISHFGWFWRTR
jgi:hypothetical protein